MKRLLVIALLAATGVMTGCGDTGERMIKAAAKAIVEEDNKTAEAGNPAATQPAAQPELVYSTEPSAQPQQDNSAYYEQAASQDPDYAVDEALPPKPTPAPAARSGLTETVVRYRASVLTQYGGKVLVRQAPSKNAKKLGFLYDREEVLVIGETNKCETINRIEGCWVKVKDVQNLVGYSFGGYLQY